MNKNKEKETKIELFCYVRAYVDKKLIQIEILHQVCTNIEGIC